MGWTDEENETFMVLLEKFPAEKVQGSFPKPCAWVFCVGFKKYLQNF